MSTLLVFIIGVVAIVLIVRKARARLETPRTRVPQVTIQRRGYKLEWLEGAEGQGYYVRRSDGKRLHWESLPRTEGLEAVPVAGTSYRLKDIQGDGFTPGKPVLLRPEPDNPHDPNAISVWDAGGRIQAGFIPAKDAKRIGKKLENVERAIVMWETRKASERVALRLLLINRGARLSANLPVD
jgi:hypothetical protein